jgi:hypothetical protein
MPWSPPVSPAVAPSPGPAGPAGRLRFGPIATTIAGYLRQPAARQVVQFPATEESLPGTDAQSVAVAVAGGITWHVDVVPHHGASG